MKVAFVTHLCPDYRIKTFAGLSTEANAEFFLYAMDNIDVERLSLWSKGRLSPRPLPALKLGRRRITPALVSRLWSGSFDVYIKCMNGRWVLPITYAVARLRKKPVIVWSGIWSRPAGVLQRLLFPLERFLYRRADALVVYGEHGKDFWTAEGVRAERIFIAPHAVDNERYAFAVQQEQKVAVLDRLSVAADQTLVFYSGSLRDDKGVTSLLRAFAKLTDPKSVLVLGGRGNDEAALQALAARLGVTDRVRFPGAIRDSELTAFLALAAVCVVPASTKSTGKETWGMLINIAFNQSVPVITTNAAGAAAAGLVRDAANGAVVPELDVEAMRQALQQLLDDPGMRHRLGQQAFSDVQQWSTENMVAGFRAAIHAVANTGDGQGGQA